MRRHKQEVAIVSFLLLWVACACLAQEFRSTLTGRVTDPQGAVVPGVNITVTSSDTSAKFTTISGPDGLYTVPFLSPGAYTVTAEAAGFSRYQREGIQISTNQRVPLDITLVVGQASSTVTVTAEAGLLQTATASTGQVIGTNQLDSMPANSRTPLMLAQISFGVVATGYPQWQRPFYANGPSSFSMGGAPAQTNAILMNGAPINTQNNQAGYSPPQDAVMEVKTEAFQADAAYGATGGGTVNMVVKSGTNALRGTAYEFNQISKFASTPFFTNAGGQKKTVTRFNQWGVQAGGPVLIPKVFDGRNKLFWLFAYDAIKEGLPTPFVETVPSPAEKGGDFSALLKVGSQYQIYDPSTGVREGTRVRRGVFPNNLIPQDRMSAIGKSYMQFYPESNRAGSAIGQGNYLSKTVRGDTYNNELGRLDAVLGERHKLFGDFRHYELLEDRWNYFSNISTGDFLVRYTWGSTLDYVYTISPTTVLDTRLNWTHYNQGSKNRSTGYDMTKLGFPSSLAKAAASPTLPTVDFGAVISGEASNGALRPLGGSSDLSAPFNNFQVFSSLMKVHGDHILKFGADIRLNRMSTVNYGYASGRYVMSGAWTRGPLDNSTAAPLGQEWAALLLGLPDSGQFDVNAVSTTQSGYYALFLHDDYRVKSTLTLNLGIRYERELATTERYNRTIRGFDVTSASPIAAQAKAAYALSPIQELPISQFNPVGGLVFADASNRTFYTTGTHNFSPRIGFAWNPTALGGKTAIRGGAGIFFFPLGIVAVNQTGFSQSTSLVSSLDGSLTPYATLGNPFPQGIDQPTGSKQGLAQNLGKAITFFTPHPSNGYSVRWSFNVQRELAQNIVMEVGYMGNHATHLPVNQNIEFVPRSFQSTLPYRDQPTIDKLTAQVANPFAGLIPGTSLNGSLVAKQQLLMPFPQFTGVTAQSRSVGSSDFHLLQARIEKRLSKGLVLQANYQFSKLLERRSWLNPSDPALEKRPANEDRPQRLVFSATYELPFGRGKAIGTNLHPVLNQIVGGWRISPVYTYQRGQPLTWGNVIYLGGDLNLDPRGVARAFDTTRFNQDSKAQLAQNIRTFPSRFGNLRQDGQNNVDATVSKNFPIHEALSLQYRCEFFNAMNHPIFDTPDLNPVSSNFGRITLQANSERRVQMALRLMW